MSAAPSPTASPALLLGIDHVAITVADMDTACAFYDRLFGVKIVRDYAPNGRSFVRGIVLGGQTGMSLHQQGNGVELVARKPTPGAVDICFTWGGPIEAAVAHLGTHGVEIIEGPSPRTTARGLPAQSVYFRDPDGNLLELMATD